MELVEIIGYIASFGVMISFMMKDIKWLRIINSFGCAFFIAYGIMLSSYPIIITNGFIILFNAYYLIINNKS